MKKDKKRHTFTLNFSFLDCSSGGIVKNKKWGKSVGKKWGQPVMIHDTESRPETNEIRKSNFMVVKKIGTNF